MNAQKLTEGSLSGIRRGDKVRMSVDYSSASIHGLTEDDFASYERNWLLKKDEICSRFIASADERLNGRLFLGAFKDAAYEIKIIVLRVNTQGDTDAEAVIINLENGETVAKIEKLIAPGGHFGSKLNLIKDGAAHTGELLGKFLRRKIK